MKIFYTLLFFSILLSSCSVIGTSTLYKTNEKIDIQKVGFCKLESEDKLSRIFINTKEIFDSTFISTFQEKGLDMPIPISTTMSYETPDLDEICILCSKNNLDGFVIGKLTFINTEYSLRSGRVDWQNFDTEVELKLFDRNGKLLVSTLHNTFKGNSYMAYPPPHITIQDGTKGAVKRLIKEMTSND